VVMLTLLRIARRTVDDIANILAATFTRPAVQWPARFRLPSMLTPGRQAALRTLRDFFTVDEDDVHGVTTVGKSVGNSRLQSRSELVSTEQ